MFRMRSRIQEYLLVIRLWDTECVEEGFEIQRSMEKSWGEGPGRMTGGRGVARASGWLRWE